MEKKNPKPVKKAIFCNGNVVKILVWMKQNFELCTKEFLSILSYKNEVSFAELLIPLKNAGLPVWTCSKVFVCSAYLQLSQEESMRREIHTIKNELNSLKELHRHLADYHPPQGNQHSEQVENLKVSVFTSCSVSCKIARELQMWVFLILSVMSTDPPLTWLNLKIYVTMTLNIIETYSTYRMFSFHQERCLCHRKLRQCFIHKFLPDRQQLS